jgi:hypothetical protein
MTRHESEPQERTAAAAPRVPPPAVRPDAVAWASAIGNAAVARIAAAAASTRQLARAVDEDERQSGSETSGQATTTAFHGANGDKILRILGDGKLKPSGGRIFVGGWDRTRLYMHGADSARRASFVMEVEVSYDRSRVRLEYTSTRGVPNTVILHTTDEVPVRVLRLFARRKGEDGWEEQEYVGESAIRQALQIPDDGPESSATGDGDG